MYSKDLKSSGTIRTYSRVLRYLKPYWFRLTIGIVCGFLVGGSLFFSIIMIPQMAMSVDASGNAVPKLDAESTRKIEAISEDSTLSTEEKSARISALLHPVEQDPKLAQMRKKIETAIVKYRLPAKLDGYTLKIEKPFAFEFELVSSDGRVAWQLLLLYMIGFVLLWAFKNLATYGNAYYMSWVGERVVNDMRNEIFAKITRQSLRYFGQVDVGQLISRTANDTAAIQRAVSSSIADLTRCPLEIVACLAALVAMGAEYNNYSLPVLMFVGLPLIMAPVMLLRRMIRKSCVLAMQEIANVYSRMHEVFSCIRLVKSYNTETQEIEKFRVVNYKYFRMVVKIMKPALLMSPLMELIAVIGILAFLIYAYCTNVTLGQIFTMLAPAFMIYRPIKDTAAISNALQQSMAAADRYFETIDLVEDLKESPTPVELSGFHDRIALEKVTFAYDGRVILDGIDLEIPRGHVVAVVGETGSGKTTLANLIARFYDVDSGAVKIDGTNVRDYSLKSLHENIGVVNQESIMFNDTIANNIAYGCPNATREEIIRAAQQANAHEFIVDGRHAEGYDTVVGEKGFKLSGGEKQRIAIARAILKNPPILILDEATSALDTVTEKLVQDALNKVMTNRTVFAIAHRLSTIKDADRIIVLDKGSIVESGTHDELLALNGLYRKLYDTQFAEH